MVKTDSPNCETETANRTLQTGQLLYLLTDKCERSRGRYFNVNRTQLIVTNGLNEFKKRQQQEQRDTRKLLHFYANNFSLLG